MEPEPYIPYPSNGLARWWSAETVAVVTGANKGIGFALVKRLAELGLTVILTARDSGKGEAAVKALRAQGLVHVHFLQLDVSDPASIKTFVSSFQASFGALDILVNNAGVSFNDLHENSVQHAETVLNTNFHGPKLLIQALFPMFRLSSAPITRILNVSSRLGSLDKMRNEEMRELLQRENLLEEQIEGTVRLFLKDVKNGIWKSRGWPQYWTDYAVSKLALNAYSRVLAKQYQGSGLSINCLCPGFTQTSMTNGKGTHTAEQAASVAATLALLSPQDLPTGKFFLIKSRAIATSKL